MKLSRQIINIVGAPIVLLACITIAILMVKSREAPPTFPRQEAVATVNTTLSEPTNVRPEIKTYGTTQTYLSTSISSQVNGELVELSPSFEVGKSVKSGEWLAKINPADFEAALANRQSALAAARQALAEEETRSRLAKEDWLAANRPLDEASDLTLRVPQLESAQAALASAQAAVQQAKTDLQRATIRAPFDAIIESRESSPGDIVTRGSTLGSLLAREKIEVRLPLTPQQASRLTLPRFGATLDATLTTPTLPGATWHATINRTEPSVDPKNQSVYVIGEILDPFEDRDSFLPVGAFVNANITGKEINDVHRLPESAVVDDAFIWVVSPEQTIRKQPIEIAFSQDGLILARIEDPVYELPLQVLTLPLASFKEGQKVNPQVKEGRN
ncbi:efflux RND transporter periplasmic adaptor subunit [Pelagicoccus sp. SDUM812003]|uniref:efflux RND transporter periplasmic adaptor subunit n=1 Tax=Pelagicoccus sp. SDUM812003 TaxID=3041267 RepID=UPI00280D0229|nr:efflux RND transporter periplasmic adaptor subunit [Pelagicoccus sp. SDUM812003]MDQ8201866.1 efflux RND transporter periplasmic adaptor subunit [Pelagicoccus sp. SDUM812003]